MARPDYGRARWYGANRGNYSNANRGKAQISRVVVHVTQGSWSSAINWFKDSRANVSAHYVVRKDGFIGQSVQEKDIPYHAGNWTYNKTSIGIEHAGYADYASTWTDAMLRSSARLTAYLCRKYNIPIDRKHIVGHVEVPGSTHYCPGKHFPYTRYIRLVRSYSGTRQRKTYKQMVDNGWKRFSATPRWGVSSYSSQKRGRSYRYTRPRKYANYASYRFRIPRKGRYTVFARWPANSGYNSRARFRIRTANGWVYRSRDQRRNGGRWVKLGTFTLYRGDRTYVQISARSPRSGYIIADAVMIKSV